MRKSVQVATVQSGCVACGTCVPYCPMQAIQIPNGITASIDPQRCVGCKKCVAVCPASTITLQTRELKHA
ncbi:MAG: 4Fe-4S binding protein [Erysipelotrichaceae bacterium]